MPFAKRKTIDGLSFVCGFGVAKITDLIPTLKLCDNVEVTHPKELCAFMPSSPVTSTSYAAELMGFVCHAALEAGLSAVPISAQDESLGFIARIKLWLCLIWGRGDIEVQPVYNAPLLSPNRAKLRIEKRRMPLARRGDILAPILYRCFGRAFYLRHLYDYSLTGRVRWCFTAWNWKWESRVFFKENPLTRRKKREALSRSFVALITLFPD